MKWIAGIVAVATAALILPGCWPKTESYRYKLTFAINTPAGVMRASSVGEALFWRIVIPDRGITHQLRGEALYLDLGAGRRPLIALLTKRLHPRTGKEVSWSHDGGPNTQLIARIYGKTLSEDLLEQAAAISGMRGAREIGPSDLPDLVTFADTNNPGSVIEIDPNNLQAALGPDVSWNRITLEITDEPITTGLKAKLPWWTEYFENNLRLNGRSSRVSNELSNVLGWDDFSQKVEVRKSK